MSDLFDDLIDGSGRDYFFALDSAAGGLTPGVGSIQVTGLPVTIFQQIGVFRTPATAVLTISGQSLSQAVPLSPAPAVLSLVGQISGQLREKIITLPMPDPVYDIPAALVPTILFINTITPTTGSLTLNSLTLNVSQGGDIGFVSPGVGALSFAYGEVTLIFHPVELGSLALVGHAPSLLTELVIGGDEEEMSVGSLTIQGLAPTLSLPFQWIDVEPPPALSWTTSTGVAA